MLKKNVFDQYEHLETNFVFDNKTHKIVGKHVGNGTIIELSENDKEIADKYKFDYGL